MHPLDRVGIEQPVVRLSLQHQRELPRQIAGIVETGVQTAHPEDRHQVRGVAGEQHAAMTVVVEREALGVVDGDPQRLPRRGLADHLEVAAHARQHLLGLDGFGRVFVVADLVVDAPDVAGLAMHQDGRARIGGRIEPRQPLDLAPGFLLDVDDHVAAFVLHAIEPQAELLAHRAASAVAGGQPIGSQRRAFTADTFDIDLDAGRALPDGHRPCRPAHVDHACAFLGGAMRILLDVVLLNVHHRRIALRRR